MGGIREAFFAVCADAEPARASYVSLYRTDRWYGGPEEGGWWGRDDVLVAHHKAACETEAESVLAQVEELARDLSRQEKDKFHRVCAEQTAWLEARGLDDDFLPEVDGEASYFVTVESRSGENAYEGSRYYE